MTDRQSAPTQPESPQPEHYSLSDALDDVEVTILNGAGALTNLRRAELDRAGETARLHTRSITDFHKRLTEMVTFSTEVAESCIYSMPRGGTRVTGPTVRFAELVYSAWGNLDVGVVLISLDRDAAILEGRCTDHEVNNSTALHCRRPVQSGDLQNVPVNKRAGRIRDAQQLAVSSGTSIAKRNAILSVVPRVFWEGALNSARDTSLGKGLTFQERRDRAMDWFQAAGASDEQVYAALGVPGFDDVTSDHLHYLSGLRSSIKQKQITLADALKPPSAEPTTGRSSVMSRLGGQPDPQPEA